MPRPERCRTHADKTAENRPARPFDWLRAGFDRGTGHHPQLDELPGLARLLHEIRPGEMLVVVRLDRLARSVGQLAAYWRCGSRAGNPQFIGLVLSTDDSAAVEEWLESIRCRDQGPALSARGEAPATG